MDRRKKRTNVRDIEKKTTLFGVLLIATISKFFNTLSEMSTTSENDLLCILLFIYSMKRNIIVHNVQFTRFDGTHDTCSKKKKNEITS